MARSRSTRRPTSMRSTGVPQERHFLVLRFISICLIILGGLNLGGVLLSLFMSFLETISEAKMPAIERHSDLGLGIGKGWTMFLATLVGLFQVATGESIRLWISLEAHTRGASLILVEIAENIKSLPEKLGSSGTDEAS